MKLRKILSALCAAAVLTAALPAVSAAEAEPLSKYAGKTIPIQVVEETETGWNSRFIEVEIPSDATKAEKNALVFSAALGQSTFTDRETYLLIDSNDENIRVTQTPQKVCGGPLPAGLTKLTKTLIDVEIESMGSTSATLSFQVRDASDLGIYTNWASLDVHHYPWEVIILCGGLPTTSKGITVYAKTGNAWDVNLSSCSVYGV